MRISFSVAFSFSSSSSPQGCERCTYVSAYRPAERGKERETRKREHTHKATRSVLPPPLPPSMATLPSFLPMQSDRPWALHTIPEKEKERESVLPPTRSMFTWVGRKRERERSLRAYPTSLRRLSLSSSHLVPRKSLQEAEGPRDSQCLWRRSKRIVLSTLTCFKNMLLIPTALLSPV